MTTRFRIEANDFAPGINDATGRLATAATATIREAAAQIKQQGRDAIRAAGMGNRFANSLRVTTFPKDGIAANPAAVVQHNAPYAGIFQTGGTIAGDPYLWLPLTTTRQRFPVTGAFGARFTVAHAKEACAPLFRLVRPGRPPLLFGTIGRQRVPLFVGVPRVTIGRKFDIEAIVERARAQLPSLYQKHLERV